MKLLLARHGQTDWNFNMKIQGQTDTVLNDRGRAQARELGERLRQTATAVSAIYASPQKRAFETAEIAGEILGLSPRPLEGLREVSFGIWEGHSWVEVHEKWPGRYEEYQAHRYTCAPPEGESFEELLHRVLPGLEEIKAQEQGPVLVVTHSAVIKGLLCYLDGMPFEKIDKYSLRNAEWKEVEW